jgi:hypothetical protein
VDLMKNIRLGLLDRKFLHEIFSIPLKSVYWSKSLSPNWFLRALACNTCKNICTCWILHLSACQHVTNREFKMVVFVRIYIHQI